MKKIIMKNFVMSSKNNVIASTLGCVAISLPLVLTACGDDVTNDSVVKAESYSTKADLPECNEKLAGAFATVPSKKEVYVCSEGSWKGLTNNASAVSEDGEFACSTVELSGKNGYKVVCGGDSVAVVTNGAAGDKGGKGLTGSDGLTGDKGTDGTGSNGRDLTLSTGDCALLDAGSDYVVYDCGDSVYVKNLVGNKANFYTWNAIESANNSDYGDPWDFIHEQYLGHWSSLYNDQFGTKASGSIERWEGDNKWINNKAYNLGLVADYYAYEGKALLTLTDDIETSVANYRPYVGIRLAFPDMSSSDYGGSGDDIDTRFSGYDIASWGGVCLTYSSETKMNILLKNGDKFVIAEIPATNGKDATVNVIPADFKVLDGADYAVIDVINAVDTVTVELLGSNKKGEYTNTFALNEFGAYRKCLGYTKNVVPTEIKARKGKEGTFEDPRDGKTYKTITIGDQTWMAENLDYDYKVHVDPLHDGEVEDKDFKCDAGHPCVEKLTYEYENKDQAKLFGRLYSWAAAIDSASLARAETPLTCGNGTFCALPETVQGICPPGWHLPSAKEVKELLVAACDSMFHRLCFEQAALNSTSGWKTKEDAGENWLGVSLYPAGYYSYSNETPKEWQVGNSVYVWTAGQINDGTKYDKANYFDSWNISSFGKANAAAVRCIQDQVKK